MFVPRSSCMPIMRLQSFQPVTTVPNTTFRQTETNASVFELVLRLADAIHGPPYQTIDRNNERRHDDRRHE